MKKGVLILFVFTITTFIFYYTKTSAENPKNYLKGKFYSSVKNYFLIATKKMNDSRFEKTVITMFESNKDGAWGLVINKPIGLIPIALLIDPSFNTSIEKE